jgi:hypothetical protein
LATGETAGTDKCIKEGYLNEFSGSKY